MKGKLIILSAPSGAGKTSIVRHLLGQGLPLCFSISATSRSKRDNERHEKDYYFLSADEFKKKIEEDQFLEWEEVYPGQFYGTLKSEVEKIRSEGCHVVFDIDVSGGITIKNQFGKDALSIFIKPPSVRCLEQRLSDRGTESEESMKKRISKAEYELSFENRFDKVVVNDNLAEAQQEVADLVKSFIGI